jgi:hypothetical protein
MKQYYYFNWSLTILVARMGKLSNLSTYILQSPPTKVWYYMSEKFTNYKWLRQVRLFTWRKAHIHLQQVELCVFFNIQTSRFRVCLLRADIYIWGRASEFEVVAIMDADQVTLSGVGLRRNWSLQIQWLISGRFVTLGLWKVAKLGRRERKAHWSETPTNLMKTKVKLA